MSEDTRKWYQKKRFILPALVFLPPLGIGLAWNTQWPKPAKIIISIVFGTFFLAAFEKYAQETAQVPTPAPSTATTQTQPSSSPPSIQPVSSPEATPSPQPKSIVKAEHQGKPVYVDEAHNQYMVLVEPVGNLGQLNMMVINLEYDDTVPVTTNCIDYQQKGNGADMQMGETVDPNATIEDFADWISSAVKTFCNDWKGGTTTAQATPSPRTVPRTPLPETRAMLISDEPGSKINVRSGPSTTASAPAYGYAVDRVALLAKSTDEANATWYQVRFEESRHVGWVREDFVTTDLNRSIPSPTPSPEPVVSREPIRAPVSGSCDCPYDTTRSGRSCGGNSAYSRPGGAEPICYTTDQ